MPLYPILFQLFSHLDKSNTTCHEALLVVLEEKQCAQHCYPEAALDVIGDKWKGVILFHLLDGKKRFNQLQKLIPSASQRMLTLQLRHLEEDELIIRTVYPVVPPKVEYELTPLGYELKSILFLLREWGKVIMEREKK